MTNRIQRLILASASPRRSEILAAAGISFEVMPSSIEERQRQGEAPEAFVCRVAEEKTLDVLARVASARDAIVVGADTIVVINGVTLGKPSDAADATRMLRLLSGREHNVLTGVCLARHAPLAIAEETGALAQASVVKDLRMASTTVKFAELTAQQIDAYIATGEPFDKAGAYAIQGRASKFVEWIHGD